MNNPTLYLEATYGLQVPGGEAREPRGPAEVRRKCGAQGAEVAGSVGVQLHREREPHRNRLPEICIRVSSSPSCGQGCT